MLLRTGLLPLVNQRLGLHQKAISDCTKAIALQPDRKEAFEIRGRSLAATNRLAEAKADYRRAKALTAKSKIALINSPAKAVRRHSRRGHRRNCGVNATNNRGRRSQNPFVKNGFCVSERTNGLFLGGRTQCVLWILNVQRRRRFSAQPTAQFCIVD